MIIRSGLHDGYTLDKETIAVRKTAIQGQPNNAANKKVIFKNCTPFTNCISRIKIAQVDDVHDVVIPMYNLIEYSNNYSKIIGILHSAT